LAHTDKMAHQLASLLQPDLSGFRYTRSRTQFRKTENPFSDDLIINVTSRSGASHSIAFYIGVAHSEVEAFVANLEGRKVSPYDRTILQYSPNVLKQAVIPFDGSVWWWGLPPGGDLAPILADVHRFVTEFALAYYSRFHDLRAIRESLVKRDGLSLNINAFKQVLAIDAVLADDEHVGTYLSLLQDEIDSGYHHDCDEFNVFYDRLSKTDEDLFPSFRLHPRGDSAGDTGKGNV